MWVLLWDPEWSVGGWLQHPCKDDESPGRNLCEDLGLGWDSRGCRAFEASDILSYNVVQDHEGILPIKGYRGLRPPGDLIYSDLSVLKPWICMFRLSSPCAMGIISKSVAHALVRGAHGAFSGLTLRYDQEYGKRQASSIFTAIKRNQGCTFQNPRNLIARGFVRGTRTEQRRGTRSYIHVVIAGIRTTQSDT